MAKITGFKRLVKEDFPDDQQPLIEKLATVFNLFQEQVYYAFSNGISLADNVNAQTSTIRVKVSSTGVPTGNNQIKYNLKTRPVGSTVINVQNVTDTTLLAGSPFVTFTLAGSTITLTQITGLLPNKEYDITIVFYG
jgi:hypothetical protein